MSIKTNFLYSSFLTTANYLFPLITYPYISRVLGVTNIGICNFVDSIIHYFVLCSTMGIGYVGIREIAANKFHKEKLDESFSGLFWLNTITTLIALTILVFVTLFIDQLRVHWQMMLIGAIKLIVSYMLIEWLYKGLEEFKYITIRTLTIRVAYVICIFLFVRNRDDYSIYYLLTVLMVFFNAFINMIYSRNFVSLKWKNINISLLLKPFLILGVYRLLTSMYTSFNVAFLGFICGEKEVGYYSTASKLYTFLIALFTAFTGVMLPRMSSLLSEGRIEDFKKLLSKSNSILFSFSIPLIIFTIIYAGTIVRIIAGNGYGGAVLPMRIMMPLMLIIGYEQVIIIQALMPLGKDNAILRNSIVGAVVGILMNILLVSSYRSVGSSLVWFSSEIAVLCSAQYYVNKYLGVSFPFLILTKKVIIHLPMIALLLWVFQMVEDMILSITISAIIMICYVYVINYYLVKDEIVIDVINSTQKMIHKKFTKK